MGNPQLCSVNKILPTKLSLLYPIIAPSKPHLNHFWEKTTEVAAIVYQGNSVKIIKLMRCLLMENISHVDCANEKISETSYLNYVKNLISLIFVFLTVHGVRF